MSNTDTIVNILRNDLTLYAERVAHSLAENSAKILEDEYNYIIQRFYEEYEPKVYERHEVLGMERGMLKTYRVVVGHYSSSFNSHYLQTSIGTISNKQISDGDYFGGIEFATNDMYSDYIQSQEEVLGSFLSGYHGHPNRRIESAIKTYQHMETFSHIVSRIISMPSSIYVRRAKDYANSFKYNFI